jgi:hypothetical protein
MKIDYVEHSDPAHPEDSILRIYDFDATEATELKDLFRKLADGRIKEIELTSLPFIYPIEGIKLILRSGQQDDGISQISQNAFLCVLSPSGWIGAMNLTHPNMIGFNWLYDLETDIDFLLSKNGGW